MIENRFFPEIHGNFGFGCMRLPMRDGHVDYDTFSAMADAFIAGWKTKYTVNLLRPITYVQLVIDSNWVPSLMHTPPFPEYPSGHSVQSSSAAAILEKRFGANTRFTDNTHNDRGWGPRTFASFKAAADEAAVSRLYAGIHFRTGIEAGKVQGRCVASEVLKLKFEP